MTALRPKPGFNALLIQWAAPDQPPPQQCSYCDVPLPDEESDPGFIPLILWNGEGWAAYFCDDCQRQWWGLSSFRHEEEE